MDWREKILVFGLMLIQINTAECVDRFCRFGQSDPCNAVVGDKLSLQMLPDNRGVNLDLYKGLSGSGLRVLKYINSKETFHESIRNRCAFIHHNWTLIINSVITEDSGDYRLEFYDPQATKTSEQHLQVYIEDPLVLPMVLGCFAMILIVLIIAAYYFYHKKKKQQLKPPSNEMEPKKKEEELHYGEVTFSSQRPQQSQTPQECVYAQVQTR